MSDNLDHLKYRFNPEYYHSKALRILDDVNKEECLGWYKHPCTQSLINSLEGDTSAIVLTWVAGGYSREESIEATAQRQAKARGMLQAISDILEHINEIKIKTLEGEDYAND